MLHLSLPALSPPFLLLWSLAPVLLLAASVQIPLSLRGRGGVVVGEGAGERTVVSLSTVLLSPPSATLVSSVCACVYLRVTLYWSAGFWWQPSLWHFLFCCWFSYPHVLCNVIAETCILDYDDKHLSKLRFFFVFFFKMIKSHKFPPVMMLAGVWFHFFFRIQILFRILFSSQCEILFLKMLNLSLKTVQCIVKIKWNMQLRYKK